MPANANIEPAVKIIKTTIIITISSVVIILSPRHIPPQT
jgi:hypothetical protein